MFVPACKAAAPEPTDDDKIAAITAEPGSDYAFANKGGPSGASGGCMILFHVIRAGPMTPVTSGFQVFVDGKQVPVLPNGLARLVNMPKQFILDVRVPSGGATGPIFRQCNKPQTTLLMVAKDWDKLGKGADWLWVKSGKFAGQENTRMDNSKALGTVEGGDGILTIRGGEAQVRTGLAV